MRREKIKIICGNCQYEHNIRPPRKYLKKTWSIHLKCGKCEKMNYVSFFFGKDVRLIGVSDE